MGHSFGGQAVSMLQTTPLTRGLIHRVFSMSSARPSPYVVHDTQEEAERRYAGVPASVGATSLADLRATPADRLTQTQVRFYDPHVDGYFFPEQPRDIWEKGKQNGRRDAANQGQGAVYVTDFARAHPFADGVTFSGSTPGVQWPEWTVASPRYVEFGDAITVREARRDRLEFLWSHDSTPHHNKPFPDGSLRGGAAEAQ